MIARGKAEERPQICASCGRGKNTVKITLLKREGMSVALCEDDANDWFRRERAFVEARGEVFDAAVAGRPVR